MKDTKTKAYKKGTAIQWKWGAGVVDGTVEEVHMGPVEREIKGSKIKRNGSVEKPAYLVRSDSGNIALKLHTELMEKPS